VEARALDLSGLIHPSTCNTKEEDNHARGSRTGTWHTPQGVRCG
jgi:hypothetical protein